MLATTIARSKLAFSEVSLTKESATIGLTVSKVSISKVSISTVSISGSLGVEATSGVFTVVADVDVEFDAREVISNNSSSGTATKAFKSWETMISESLPATANSKDFLI